MAAAAGGGLRAASLTGRLTGHVQGRKRMGAALGAAPALFGPAALLHFAPCLTGFTSIAVSGHCRGIYRGAARLWRGAAAIVA